MPARVHMLLAEEAETELLPTGESIAPYGSCLSTSSSYHGDLNKIATLQVAW